MTYPITNDTPMEDTHPALHNNVLAGSGTEMYVHPDGDDANPRGSWGSANDGQAAGVHVCEDLRCAAGMEYRRSGVDPPCSGAVGLQALP